MSALELPEPPEGLSLTKPGLDGSGMFRSAFGEPKPRSFDQLLEAMDEMEVDLYMIDEVAITDSREEPEDTVWHGWTAEIRTDAGMDDWIQTGGWPTREALVDDLIKLGIKDHQITDEEY